ncbi:hypothetical protein, partial [Pseudomonas viridiflava]|uniref:hypothetical protein n=1 Tax=Pseudomonas viridiflava TaxID=33069 RepID=UPI0019D10DD1
QSVCFCQRCCFAVRKNDLFCLHISVLHKKLYLFSAMGAYHMRKTHGVACAMFEPAVRALDGVAMINHRFTGRLVDQSDRRAQALELIH